MINLDTKRHINYSPRAWGCTVRCEKFNVDEALFPTSVGVYRRLPVEFYRPGTIPHERGGVPLGNNRFLMLVAYSPRAWGCTEATQEDVQEGDLFPTSVGVYRRTIPNNIINHPIPHERGGVPAVEM